MKTLLKIFFEKELIRYLFIGFFAASIDVLVFLILHELILLSALISHSISIPLSAIFSFTMNAFFNFKKTDFIFYRLSSFLIIITIGYLLGAIIILFAEFLNLGGTFGKLLSLPFVFFLQYFLNSRISFMD